MAYDQNAADWLLDASPPPEVARALPFTDVEIDAHPDGARIWATIRSLAAVVERRVDEADEEIEIAKAEAAKEAAETAEKETRAELLGDLNAARVDVDVVRPKNGDPVRLEIDVRPGGLTGADDIKTFVSRLEEAVSAVVPVDLIDLVKAIEPELAVTPDFTLKLEWSHPNGKAGIPDAVEQIAETFVAKLAPQIAGKAMWRPTW